MAQRSPKHIPDDRVRTDSGDRPVSSYTTKSRQAGGDDRRVRTSGAGEDGPRTSQGGSAETRTARSAGAHVDRAGRSAYSEPRDERGSRAASARSNDDRDGRAALARDHGSRSSGAASTRAYNDRDSRRPAARNTRRRKKKSHGGLIAAIIIILALAVGVVVVFKTGLINFNNEGTEVVQDTRPLPASPKVVSTASLGATGDILLHSPILEATATWDGYDFTNVFSNVSSVYEETDLMFANLEVTLAGADYGDGYSSYPVFNSPDAIATALKNAGVDICLTANNHTYDTGDTGLTRTLQVLDENGLEHLGTRESTDEHYLMTKNVNGIRLGMLCYTYDTREYTDGYISLNFNTLSDEAENLVNTFNYENLDEFYANVQQQLDYMDMLNVDASVIFIHWGTEYQDEPNDYQTEMAQRLCDMGVDVIIGGHPHVIQKFDTLTSADGHETVCLYSMGNELSNQRSDLMDEDGNRGYTEDGLVFQVSFEKFNNGKVKVSGVNIVPTWVQLDGNGYQIIALEGTDDPWSWGSSDTYSAIASYNRTLGRLSDAYIQYRAAKGESEITTYLEY